MCATSEVFLLPLSLRPLAITDPLRIYLMTLSPLASGAMMLPENVFFFPWETHHQKLNTNCRLNRRGSDNDLLCPFCAAIEDVPHLFLHCPRSYDFWSSLGLSAANILSVELLWSSELPGPPTQPEDPLDHLNRTPLKHLEMQERHDLPGRTKVQCHHSSTVHSRPQAVVQQLQVPSCSSLH